MPALESQPAFLRWAWDARVRLQGQFQSVEREQRAMEVLQHLVERVDGWARTSGWVNTVHLTVATMERAYRANCITRWR